MAEMRIVQRRDLRPVLVQEIDVFGEPAVLLCLVVEESPRVRSRKRHLNRVRVDLFGEV